jgi:hypothetical protein
MKPGPVTLMQWHFLFQYEWTGSIIECVDMIKYSARDHTILYRPVICVFFFNIATNLISYAVWQETTRSMVHIMGTM